MLGRALNAETPSGPVPREALDFLEGKGLQPGFSHLDVWAEEHHRAFTAAKVMREDVLRTMHEEVARAIRDGVPYQQFERELGARLERMGWWGQQSVVDPQTGKVATVDVPSRLRRIYDTNMRTARAAGQWERIERTRDMLPYLLYQVGPSARHRPDHLAWHGLLLPATDPFWDSHLPPNGWGCKCWVRQVSRREAARLERDGVMAPEPEPILDAEGRPTGHVRDRRVQVRTEAPEIIHTHYVNRRTGVAELIPEGIDPGFHRPPTQLRQPGGRPPGSPPPVPTLPAAPPPVSAAPAQSPAQAPDRATPRATPPPVPLAPRQEPAQPAAAPSPRHVALEPVRRPQAPSAEPTEQPPPAAEPDAAGLFATQEARDHVATLRDRFGRTIRDRGFRDVDEVHGEHDREGNRVSRSWVQLWKRISTDATAAPARMAMGDAAPYAGVGERDLQTAEEHLGGFFEDVAPQALRDAMRSRYAATQELLAQRGVSTVTLYRGIEGPAAERVRAAVAEGAANVPNAVRPLSSWTTDPMVAQRFGDVVLAAEFPVDQVFSHYEVDAILAERVAGTSEQEVIIYSATGTIDVSASRISYPRDEQ